MAENNSNVESRLAALGSPYESKDPKYDLESDVQSRILALMLCDKRFTSQSIGLVKPEYFSNEGHIEICKILMQYFLEYNSIPDRWIIREEINSKLKEKSDAIKLHFFGILDSLYEYYVPGLETYDYLLNKVLCFAKKQSMRVALYQCINKLNETSNIEIDKNLNWIYDKLHTAMSVDVNQDIGFEYFNDIDKMFEMFEESLQGKERFTTAFKSIDDALTGGGLFRGELGAWIALPGTGKSLSLCKAAVENVKLGWKTLYITLEMNTLGIAQRFTSQFTKFGIGDLVKVKDEVKKTIEAFKSDKLESNLLIVKQFPGGALDMSGIRSYYSSLETRGWKPDLLIVDYVGEMKDNPNLKKHESAFQIIQQMRGFAVEKDHCGLTCIQPNRLASTLEIHQFIDESVIGTSFDQYKTLDALWSINQLPMEKEAGVARGYVIKHRNGKSRFDFKMAFDYQIPGTLDVYEISNDQYNIAMASKRDEKASLVKLDPIKIKKNKGQRSIEGYDPVNPSDSET